MDLVELQLYTYIQTDRQHGFGRVVAAYLTNEDSQEGQATVTENTILSFKNIIEKDFPVKFYNIK